MRFRLIYNWFFLLHSLRLHFVYCQTNLILERKRRRRRKWLYSILGDCEFSMSIDFAFQVNDNKGQSALTLNISFDLIEEDVMWWVCVKMNCHFDCYNEQYLFILHGIFSIYIDNKKKGIYFVLYIEMIVTTFICI